MYINSYWRTFLIRRLLSLLSLLFGNKYFIIKNNHKPTKKNVYGYKKSRTSIGRHEPHLGEYNFNTRHPNREIQAQALQNVAPTTAADGTQA